MSEPGEYAVPLFALIDEQKVDLSQPLPETLAEHLSLYLDGELGIKSLSAQVLLLEEKPYLVLFAVPGESLPALCSLVDVQRSQLFRYERKDQDTVTLTPPSGADLDMILFTSVSTRTLEEQGLVVDVMAVADLAAVVNDVSVADITSLTDVAAVADIPTGGDVVAVGAQPGSTPERAGHRVWLDTGSQHVLVVGHNGAHSGDAPYSLDIEVDPSKAWDPTSMTLPDYSPPAFRSK